MRLEEFEAKAHRAVQLVAKIRALKEINLASPVDVLDALTGKAIVLDPQLTRQIVNFGIEAVIKEMEDELSRIFGDPGPCDHCAQHECHCPTLHIHD